MSEQKPPNPGRRRFFGEILSTFGREAGLLAREAQLAAWEIEDALADAPQPTIVETPIHADLDGAELAERLDAIETELPELAERVERLVNAAAQPQPLVEEDRALLVRVVELLAERHAELAEDLPGQATKADNPDPHNEAAVLRRRRQVLKEKFWSLISALLGIRLFDALYETFVSDELVPWAKEEWRSIFAQVEAAGVIEQPTLASPMPSPAGESPSPVETPTPKPETPTPPLRSSSGFDWVTIPAGQFLMGSTKSHVRDMIAYARKRNYYVGEFKEGWITCELPQHRLYLPEYRIARTPVTVTQFAAFVRATGYRTTAEEKGTGWAKKQMANGIG